MAQSHAVASRARRYGYRYPVDLVVSPLDVRRDLARELAHLAQRLDDGTIESIHRGEVCDGRMLEETRLGEAGASPEEIARTRDMGLDRRGERVTPAGPERPMGQRRALALTTRCLRLNSSVGYAYGRPRWRCGESNPGPSVLRWRRLRAQPMASLQAIGLHRRVTVRPTPGLISTPRSEHPGEPILLNDAHSEGGRNPSGGRATFL